MKRLAILAILPFITVACNRPSNLTTEPIAQSNEALNNESPSTNDSSDQRIQLAKKLTDELATVSNAANVAQQAFDFRLASTHWKRAEEILLQLYGRDAWQTKNAVESFKAAEYQSELSESQKSELRKLYGIQAQIAQDIQQHRPAEALILSKQATGISTQLFPVDSYMFAKQQIQLGRLEQLNNNFDPALNHYREANTTLLKILGENHPDLEGLHGFLGECFLAKGESTRAIENFKFAAKIAGEVWGQKSLGYAVRANDLAVAFHRLHDLPTALKIFRDVESIRREQLGSEHPLVAHSLFNLAIVYIDLNRYELASQSLEQALPILKKSFGNNNKLVLDCQSKLATTLLLLERPQQAELLLREQLETLESLKADPNELATAQYRLGIALSKQQKFPDAELLFKAAMGSQENSLGPTHPATARTKSALANLYFQTNRKELAEQLASSVKSVNFESESNFFEK